MILITLSFPVTKISHVYLVFYFLKIVLILIFLILRSSYCRREEEKEKLELKVELNHRRVQFNDIGQKRSPSASILNDILKNDVPLELLKIAKATTDMEIEQIEREKEESQVSEKYQGLFPFPSPTCVRNTLTIVFFGKGKFFH